MEYLIVLFFNEVWFIIVSFATEVVLFGKKLG
jgi:hypothetical protein